MDHFIQKVKERRPLRLCPHYTPVETGELKVSFWVTGPIYQNNQKNAQTWTQWTVNAMHLDKDNEDYKIYY